MIFSQKRDHPLFPVYDPIGIKVLTRLILEFSHLNEQKFRHGFKDTLIPICACRDEIEITKRFFLRCQSYCTYRFELFDDILKVHQHLLYITAKNQELVLPCSSQRNNSKSLSINIINFAVKSLKSTCCFDRSMFNGNQ